MLTPKESHTIFIQLMILEQCLIDAPPSSCIQKIPLYYSNIKLWSSNILEYVFQPGGPNSSNSIEEIIISWLKTINPRLIFITKNMPDSFRFLGNIAPAIDNLHEYINLLNKSDRLNFSNTFQKMISVLSNCKHTIAQATTC